MLQSLTKYPKIPDNAKYICNKHPVKLLTVETKETRICFLK